MTSQALISKINCTLSANHKRDSEFNVKQYEVKSSSKYEHYLERSLGYNVLWCVQRGPGWTWRCVITVKVPATCRFLHQSEKNSVHYERHQCFSLEKKLNMCY